MTLNVFHKSVPKISWLDTVLIQPVSILYNFHTVINFYTLDEFISCTQIRGSHRVISLQGCLMESINVGRHYNWTLQLSSLVKIAVNCPSVDTVCTYVCSLFLRHLPLTGSGITKIFAKITCFIQFCI